MSSSLTLTINKEVVEAKTRFLILNKTLQNDIFCCNNNIYSILSHMIFYLNNFDFYYYSFFYAYLA